MGDVVSVRKLAFDLDSDEVLVEAFVYVPEGRLQVFSLLEVGMDFKMPPQSGKTSWRHSDLRVEGQNARRQKIVARQKEARRRNIAAARARSLISGTENAPSPNDAQEYPDDDATSRQESDGMAVDNVAEDAKESKRSAAKRRRRREEEEAYAGQLQRPEWMLEVPLDLGPEAWSVMPKPDGDWVLVIAAHGKTVSRKKNGRILHEFASALPHGSPRTGTGASEFSMLQCVFHEADRTYYVIDVVWWKGLDVGASDFSFRQFWLHSKLGETPAICDAGPGNAFRFQPVPVFECSLQGLGQAYTSQTPFIKDGLLFFYNQGQYEEGLSPCLLAWKDAATSRFPIDSPDGVNPYPEQTCVLQVVKVAGEQMLRALGNDVVGRVDPGDGRARDLSDGARARFVVPPGGLRFTTPESSSENALAQSEVGPPPGPIAAAVAAAAAEESDTVAHVWISGLRYHSSCRPHARPDASCRIAFQYAMRHDPLTIEKLSAQLRSSDEHMAT